MSRIALSRGWKLARVPTSNEWSSQQTGKSVDAPHDAMIGLPRSAKNPSGPSGAYYPGSEAAYEKTLSVPEEWRGKVVLLESDGIYMNATVRVNRNIAARQPYGYSPFVADLTPYLRAGEDNLLRVTADNSAQPNSRWYSGTGMIRDLWLHVLDPLHFAVWGTAVTTSLEEGAAVVACAVRVENAGDAVSAKVCATLLDADGKAAATAEACIDAPKDGEATANASLSLSKPNLWTPDTPYLYTLRLELMQDGRVIDTQDILCGVRSVDFSVKNGFRLNGQTMKLKGGCVHHDCGILGAAAYADAEERKIRLLKASGFNAVRCAHNPPSAAFLDACDRLGMLVIDEAFDCWREGKNPYDYNLYFENWWKRDMKAMIDRDRNHPSIILWSTGNEIVERGGISEGYRWARELADYTRELDPSRDVTNALCDIWNAQGDDPFAEKTPRFAEPLDVSGYNYLIGRYDKDAELYPDRIICATETYPKFALEYWDKVEQYDHIIGDFVWTSLDYIGEAGIGHTRFDGKKADGLGGFPWRIANCGDIDICGFKRPQSYFRDCVWGISDKPYIAVHDPAHYGEEESVSRWGWPQVFASWDWAGYEGKPLCVDVYSRAEQVELLLNGKPVGTACAGKANHYTASFEFAYEPGELTAIETSGGKETARAILRTPGAAASIALTPDAESACAGWGHLVYISAELLDGAGQRMTASDDVISFSVSGGGELIACGNSDPQDDGNYTDSRNKLYEGRALAIVRTKDGSESIAISAFVADVPAGALVVKR